jgi:selenocysteine-specific elongation factor
MIIGTAGHIDHGKSTLIAALTGRAMDRLAEERRRGITIDLNFAPLELEGLPPVGIVDVPGHEDLVRTMVAGASGIDVLLLVVDAQEGLRPQTHEHLAIAEQLKIPAGIAVLSKCDLAAPDWLEMVEAELVERLARSTIRFGAPLAVSAMTGQGLEALRAEIRRQSGLVRSRSATGEPFRMPIDRVFTIAGAGTVVTGTVWSGTVSPGQTVRIEPGGREARIRTVESFGTAAAVASPGTRTALNLTGLNRTDLSRGMVIIRSAAAWPATDVLDTVTTLLADARPLAPRTRVRLHHGTAEVMARAWPRTTMTPGETGLVRLVLEEPVLARGGDRFVLRSYSPPTTVGGGWVADPAPPRKPAWAEGLGSREAAARLEVLVARRVGGVRRESLPVLLGLPEEECEEVAWRTAGITLLAGRWVVRSRAAEARVALEARVATHHREDPSSPGISLETLRGTLGAGAWMADALLELLIQEGRLAVSGGQVARRGFTPSAAGGEGEVAVLSQALAAAGLEAPSISELGNQLGIRDPVGALRIAMSRGLVDQVTPEWFVGREALDRFTAILRDIGAGGGEVTPAEVRDRVGLSRKFLIPLLEWADRKRITRRDPTGRRTLV